MIGISEIPHILFLENGPKVPFLKSFDYWKNLPNWAKSISLYEIEIQKQRPILGKSLIQESVSIQNQINKLEDNWNW